MPSLRGAMMVDTCRGVLRVRKWPKKRGRPKSALQRWWNDWFVQANLLAKYADGMTQARAIALTKNSGLYPRDIMLRAMRGRLYWWVDQDGNRWYPMAGIQDISDTLDVLAQAVGSVLVRATDRWRAPPAGVAGDLFTCQGVLNPPTWETPAPPGTPARCYVSKTAVQSIPNAAATTITWNTEYYDDAGIHDNAVNPSRFTMPAGAVRASAVFQIPFATHGGNWDQAHCTLNGAGMVPLVFDRVPPLAGTTTVFQLIVPPVPVAPGDYLELEVIQNSGGAVNFNAAPTSWASVTINP